MKENTFVWADLSSYNPQVTKSFYEAVFGWKYSEYQGYFTAYKGFKEVVGLYETPQKFKDMNMPSFWMSYIQVDSVVETVEKARNLGAIIELVDTDNPIGGIALIRDTLGAGFTIYDGNWLNSRTQNKVDTLIFNELHISDFDKVLPFYKNLFNWDFKKTNSYTYDVFCSSSSKKIAAIKELDYYTKGKYEYWTCVFGVKDLSKTLKRITDNNGIIISTENGKAMCSDGSEAFFYIEELG